MLGAALAVMLPCPEFLADTELSMNRGSSKNFTQPVADGGESGQAGMAQDCGVGWDPPGRRGALLGAAVCILGLHAEDAAAQSGDAAARARPEPGDHFVLAGGEDDSKPLAPADLKPGGQQLLAWAKHPGSGAVRSGSRLNQVLLIRLDPADLDEETRKRSADGIVAYSAVCTHQQCPVSEWMEDRNALHCPCHGSEFDPRRAGKVVNGPALRPLAALPVKVENGLLVVAGRFAGRVGAPQPV